MTGKRFISIHSLRMEGDDFSPAMMTATASISIHSLRMEGDAKSDLSDSEREISIHSLRMEGDGCSMCGFGIHIISIHSLRMEGDRNPGKARNEKSYFNPLPPHGGRRYAMVSGADSSSFQSTPSAWRETQHPDIPDAEDTFQSTPSAWRETVPSC